MIMLLLRCDTDWIQLMVAQSVVVLAVINWGKLRLPVYVLRRFLNAMRWGFVLEGVDTIVVTYRVSLQAWRISHTYDTFKVIRILARQILRFAAMAGYPKAWRISHTYDTFEVIHILVGQILIFAAMAGYPKVRETCTVANVYVDVALWLAKISGLMLLMAPDTIRCLLRMRGRAGYDPENEEVKSELQSVDESSPSAMMDVCRPTTGVAAPVLEPAVELYKLLS
ncbi:hypothetical protein Tco_0809830 [Tanacetum coccineum]